MDRNATAFMKAVLGDDGANALAKAAERSPVLESALLPRSILGWLSFAARWGYEGDVPGLPDTYIEFHKSSDDAFDGSVQVGSDTHQFTNASPLQLAALVAVALGADTRIDPALRQVDVERLGKNIDLVIGARYLQLARKALELAKTHEEEYAIPQKEECRGSYHAYAPQDENGIGHCSECGHSFPAARHTLTPSHRPAVKKDELDGEHGTQAPPRAPKEPGLPVPQAKQPRLARKIRITKSQSERKCSVCEQPQFEAGEFRGCWCVRDLAKHVKTSSVEGGYQVQFDSAWSENDISVLLDMIEGE